MTKIFRGVGSEIRLVKYTTSRKFGALFFRPKRGLQFRIAQTRQSQNQSVSQTIMSNVNPQSNNLKYIPPKDADKDKEETTKKPVAPLEEDDEFEDFPVEGIPATRGRHVFGWR
jgi:hypothetical protein